MKNLAAKLIQLAFVLGGVAAGCMDLGCGPVNVMPPATSQPAVTVTFLPGAIVLQVGSDKVPLVDVNVNGRVFSATRPEKPE